MGSVDVIISIRPHDMLWKWKNPAETMGAAPEPVRYCMDMLFR